MKNQVIGAWKLESFEIESPEGKQKAWGKEAHGLLIYTDSGQMSVSINRKIEDNSKSAAEIAFDSSFFIQAPILSMTVQSPIKSLRPQIQSALEDLKRDMQSLMEAY